MLNLKGFISIYHRIDNTVSTTASVGELSAQGLTYAKEVQVYNHNDFDGLRLSVFSCRDGDRKVVNVPTLAVHNSFEFASWLDQYIVDNVVPNDTEALKEIILQRFPEITSVEIGTQVKVGNDYYPTSVTLSYLEKDCTLTLWFSDEHFRKDYDECEIVVIHPTENIDDLLLSYDELTPILSKLTYDVQVDRINAQVADYPPTATRALSYDWHDQKNDALVNRVGWTLIIYGAAGDHLEKLQNAIITDVFNTSSGTEEQWQTAVPDLFSPVEYFLIPAWHKFAVPNQTTINGIHSPLLSLGEQQRMSEVFMVEQNENHIELHSEMTCFIYKSVATVSIGCETNRNGKFKISELFKDYMLVSTTSTDFARLAPQTQEWILLVHNMLAAADFFQQSNSLPANMVLVERAGIKFVLSNINGANYLIPERESFLDHYYISEDM